MQITPPGYHFIDANVIMYTLGGPHPLRDPCKHILEEIKTGKLIAVTNTEVLQEIQHRFYSIGQFSFGEIAYQSLVQICVHIFPVTLKETNKALELLKENKKLHIPFCVHGLFFYSIHYRQVFLDVPVCRFPNKAP